MGIRSEMNLSLAKYDEEQMKKVHRVSVSIFMMNKVYKLWVKYSVTNYVGVEMYDRVPRKPAFVRILMCNRVTNLTKHIVKT